MNIRIILSRDYKLRVLLFLVQYPVANMNLNINTLNIWNVNNITLLLLGKTQILKT